MSEFNLSDLTMVVNESSVTLGSGARKRTIRSWEAVWLSSDEHIRNGKRPNLSATSSKSADDAKSLLEEQILEYLGR